MRKFFERLLSYFPTKLPHGMSEFESWSKSIIGLSRVPDNDSTRFAVAVMILHMDPSEDSKPKHWFVKKLNKAATNELAHGISMQIKKRQEERAAAEKAASDVSNQAVS